MSDEKVIYIPLAHLPYAFQTAVMIYEPRATGIAVASIGRSEVSSDLRGMGEHVKWNDMLLRVFTDGTDFIIQSTRIVEKAMTVHWWKMTSTIRVVAADN